MSSVWCEYLQIWTNGKGAACATILFPPLRYSVCRSLRSPLEDHTLSVFRWELVFPSSSFHHHHHRRRHHPLSYHLHLPQSSTPWFWSKYRAIGHYPILPQRKPIETHLREYSSLLWKAKLWTVDNIFFLFSHYLESGQDARVEEEPGSPQV